MPHEDAAAGNDLAGLEQKAERERTEQLLRRSEERFRTLVETSSDWIWEVDASGVYTYVSPRVKDLLGYEPEEVLGKTPFDFMPPEEARRVRALVEPLQAACQAIEQLENVNLHKDGRRVVLETSGRPILDAEGEFRGFRGVDRDITDRTQADHALRLTQFSVDKASESIFWIDPNGRFIYVNDAACRELGYAREELLCLSVQQIDPNYRDESWSALWAKLREQGSLKLESLHRDKNGVVFPVEIEANYIEFGGTPYDCAFVRDVSDRKRAEREREDLIARLETQNTELDRFAYTVSHDLKTPLITIKGYLGLLEEDVLGNDPQQVADDMARIGGAADRMYELLGDVLELARVGRRVNPPEDVELRELAAEALELVEGRIADSGVEVAVASDLPAVYGDRMRLREVLQNLIENAAKHMGDQPEPRIEIGARRQGDELVCYVRDNGVGIEPRYHERVFGLFDKLDPQSEGTGVGLALVKRILEVHGGRIWIESEGIGRGATFCFTLPKRA